MHRFISHYIASMIQIDSISAKALLAKLSSEYSEIPDSLVYTRLSHELFSQLDDMAEASVKVEGSLFMLLTKGAFTISYNFEEYAVEAPAAISFPPGTVVHLSPIDTTSVEAYILDYSLSFLQDVNISFNAISGRSLLDRESPVMKLKNDEMSVLLRYYSLIRSVVADRFNMQLSKHILASLTSAMFYQIMLMLYKRFDYNEIGNQGSRRANYVHDFLRLVHMHYMQERSVAFYADKLYISPKYLSMLVKETTGRSATEWIDKFVIMEAKNLLRYSGKNIQQVAYELHFNNQSSFGKYFKHITGMSPSDFQKS